MVQIESILKCNDNSGVLYVKCIHIIGKNKKDCAHLGDLIKISFIKKKKLIFKKQQKVYLGLILGLKKRTKKKNGIYHKQHTNRVVLLNYNFKLLGSRIYGPACKELYSKKHSLKLKEVFSLARGII